MLRARLSEKPSGLWSLKIWLQSWLLSPYKFLLQRRMDLMGPGHGGKLRSLMKDICNVWGLGSNMKRQPRALRNWRGRSCTWSLRIQVCWALPPSSPSLCSCFLHRQFLQAFPGKAAQPKLHLNFFLLLLFFSNHTFQS